MKTSGYQATITDKTKDPRYIPGVSEFEDDMTDAEWFEAMGPLTMSASDNPILVAHRGRRAHLQNPVESIIADALLAFETCTVEDFQRIVDRDGINTRVTEEHVEHARRVITKRARLLGI